MKILISGALGQLMTDITEHLRSVGHEVIALNKDSWDVTSESECASVFQAYKPEVYIHGASIHVIKHIIENPKLASDVNIASLYTLCKLCNEYKTRLINFSTNYVYGFKNAAEVEIASAGGIGYQSVIKNGIPLWIKPNPINIYGIMKEAGEQIVANCTKNGITLRVSGLFGKTGCRSKNHTNFVFDILNNFRNKEEFDVVSDQYMNITYTREVANFVQCLLDYETDIKVLNVVNNCATTWYEVACSIANLLDINCDRIIPVNTSNYELYNDSAKRPMFTALDTSASDSIYEMPHFNKSLFDFLKEVHIIRVKF
jgi:dTDP-4-dehydrorhamnose reductase